MEGPKENAPKRTPRRHPLTAAIKSLRGLDRQMTALPAEAQHWRSIATDLIVSAALVTDPKIKASLSALASQYERMASSAEKRYAAYVRKLESGTIFSQRLHQYAVSSPLIGKMEAVPFPTSDDPDGA